jgi:hypothetical protein
LFHTIYFLCKMSHKAAFTVDIDLPLEELLAFISKNEHYLLLNNSYHAATEKKFDYMIGIGRLNYLTTFSVADVNFYCCRCAKKTNCICTLNLSAKK